MHRDGCVYTKESSRKEEYCFMPSSTYMTECQDEGQQEVEMPGERRVQINRGKDLEEDFGAFLHFCN